MEAAPLRVLWSKIWDTDFPSCVQTKPELLANSKTDSKSQIQLETSFPGLQKGYFKHVAVVGSRRNLIDVFQVSTGSTFLNGKALLPLGDDCLGIRGEGALPRLGSRVPGEFSDSLSLIPAGKGAPAKNTQMRSIVGQLKSQIWAPHTQFKDGVCYPSDVRGHSLLGLRVSA